MQGVLNPIDHGLLMRNSASCLDLDAVVLGVICGWQ